MEQQFISTMAKAADLIGVKALEITPPSARMGWAVRTATEEQRDLLALALANSGLKNKTASRRGRHYIFEA